jgi:hypothetical protein
MLHRHVRFGAHAIATEVVRHMRERESKATTNWTSLHLAEECRL